jgi:hypothetical protein
VAKARQGTREKGKGGALSPLRPFALVCFAIISCAGCKLGPSIPEQVRTQFYANDLVAAEKLADEGLKKDSSNRSTLLLEQAIVQLSSGQPKLAEQTLRKARDHFDEVEDQLLKGGAASYLSDDTSRTYAGEDYERVLIRAFLALSNLMHDGGDAEAYSLQLMDKQEQFIVAAQTRAQARQPKPEPGQPSVAPLEFSRVALAPYMRGILREATHLNYDDAERSFVTVANWQPGFQPARTDIERAAHGAHSHPGHGVLYVFCMTGRGPMKYEADEIGSTVGLLVAGEVAGAASGQRVTPNIMPVKVPKLIAGDNQIEGVLVGINGQSIGQTATLTNVSQLAIQQYETIYPEIITRAVSRRVVKKGTVYAAKSATGGSNGNLIGLAWDAAGLVWEGTEDADLRCWSLLPDRIQVLRVELPAGEFDVQLQAKMVTPWGPVQPGRIATKRVRIHDGRNTYMLGNFPDRELVGKLMVSEPQ